MEVSEAVLSPSRIGAQAQVGVARRDITRRQLRSQLRSQLAAPVEPDPADDPIVRIAQPQLRLLRQPRQLAKAGRGFAAG